RLRASGRSGGGGVAAGVDEVGDGGSGIGSCGRFLFSDGSGTSGTPFPPESGAGGKGGRSRSSGEEMEMVELFESGLDDLRSDVRGGSEIGFLSPGKYLSSKSALSEMMIHLVTGL